MTRKYKDQKYLLFEQEKADSKDFYLFTEIF